MKQHVSETSLFMKFSFRRRAATSMKLAAHLRNIKLHTSAMGLRLFEHIHAIIRVKITHNTNYRMSVMHLIKDGIIGPVTYPRS